MATVIAISLFFDFIVMVVMEPFIVTVFFFTMIMSLIVFVRIMIVTFFMFLIFCNSVNWVSVTVGCKDCDD